ncbi:MAG: hypothetical protein JO332_18750 [Planctomycetaceae bacterium]|nr:hypothetical protein [Planctomycetaceae bacterium]
MTGIRIAGVLLLATAGCVSSRSAGVIDDDPALPPPSFEKIPRVWAKDRTLTVEVEETDGPAKIASIDYRIDDGTVYLSPVRISGRPRGVARHLVDLGGETLPDNWRDRVYWLTGESYYPIGHSAFWDPSLREPAHRTKVEFSRAPD